MEIMNSVWVHKYRPKKLDDLVLPERQKIDFQKYIERREIPNLLFYGPPGGGKTTLARILCSKEGVLGKKSDNLLLVNGSAQESRSINFVSKVIEPFLKYPPAGGDKIKIVFIDEADNLTPDSYRSLRGPVEKAQESYTRFVWTCNYISNIPEPVQSRFTQYRFRQIEKEFVFDYSKSVLDQEMIQYEDKDINFVIENLYPDVRQIVNVLQQCSLQGKLKVDEEAVTTKEKKILALVLQIIGSIEKDEGGKIGRIVGNMIEELKEEDFEYRSLYSTLFFMEKFPIQAKIVVNKYSNTHPGCLVPSMHFMAMTFEMIKTLQDYKKAVIGK